MGDAGPSASDAGFRTVPYGPSDAHWPSRTPRCELPSITVNSLPALLGALGAANAGDVIQVEAGTYGSVRVDDAALRARAATWASSNVLVCASPTARPMFDALRIEVPNTSWSGIRIAGNVSLEQGADHTRIARARLGAQSTIYIHSVDDTELVEVVILERGENAERMQISATRGGDPNPHDVLLEGCWFEGTNTTLPSESGNNIQTLSVAGTVVMRDTYIGAAGKNASIQAGAEFQGAEPYAAYVFENVFFGGTLGAGNGNVFGVGNPTRYRDCEFDLNLRQRPESFNVTEMIGCRVEPSDVSLIGGGQARDVYPDNTWGVAVSPPVFVPPAWW